MFEMLTNVRSTQGVCICAKPGFGTFLFMNGYCSYVHHACFQMTVNFSIIIIFKTFLLGSFLKPLDQCLGSNSPANLPFSPNHQWQVQLSSSTRRPLNVQASNRYSLSHFFVLPLLFELFVRNCSVPSKGCELIFHWSCFIFTNQHPCSVPTHLLLCTVHKARVEGQTVQASLLVVLFWEES